MNSLLKKRLPGILAVGLVALAVGAAGAPASAATAETSGGATVSGLNKKQKKAKKKALRKCNKKKPAKKKRNCKEQVNKKYKKIANKNKAPSGETYSVNLGDDFFSPSLLELKVNDSINWSWANIAGREPHNVTLVTGPSGVSRNDFASPLTADTGFRFKRPFRVAGDYSLVCNIHVLMTMNVNVTK